MALDVRKLWLGAWVAALLLAATTVTAQTGPNPCGAEKDRDARLACFDKQNMAVPRLYDGDKIITQFDGNGGTTTRPVDLPPRWEAQWSAESPLMVASHTADGEIDEVLAHLTATGSAYHPKGGTFYFEVIANGPWSLRIVKVP